MSGESILAAGGDQLNASVPDSSYPTFGAFGVPCYAGDLIDAVRVITHRIDSGAGGYACFANVHVLVTAQHDAELRKALKSAWMVFPDGAPVAWLQRKTGLAHAERVAGPDLMPLLCANGVDTDVAHFLLGSTSAVTDQLKRKLEHSYPGIRVVGSYSPSRRQIEEDDQVVVEYVREFSPDVVWCAFGAPRQEIWMSRNAKALEGSLFLGVGAAFEFIAGIKPRAPSQMQRLGLEWLHRLGCEPERLSGRYMRTNAEFLVRITRHRLRTGTW